MHTIYLAGKIHGISYEEATEWRNYCIKRLKDSYNFYNPMEGKEFLKEEKNISILTKSNPYDIFRQDLSHLDKSDILLVNLNYLPVFDAAWEMGYMYAKGGELPIVLLGICNNEYYNHPFVAGTFDYIFPNTELACDWLDNFVGKNKDF